MQNKIKMFLLKYQFIFTWYIFLKHIYENMSKIKNKCLEINCQQP